MTEHICTQAIGELGTIETAYERVWSLGKWYKIYLQEYLQSGVMEAALEDLPRIIYIILYKKVQKAG